MNDTAVKVTIASLSVLFLAGVPFGVYANLGLEPTHSVAFAILLVAATLWISEAVPLFVTSLLVLFLCLIWLRPVLVESGVDVENSVFLSPFFSDVILLFLGGFVLSAALHKMQLDEWLALSIIARTGKSIPMLMLGIMAITAFLSMWLSNTATAAMMMALVVPIVRVLPQGDRFRQGLLLAIPFSANIGGLGTPIGSPPNAIAMQYLQKANLAPSFGMWLLIGVPGVLSMLGIAWLILLFFYKGEATELVVEKQRFAISWTPRLIVVIATTVLVVVGWMTTAFHGYSTGTVALLPVLVFFGLRILSVDDLRSLSWDVLLLMGGGLCLGNAISTSGLADWMVNVLPVEGWSTFGLMVAFGSVACVMSSVMSNTATSNLIMPIILGLNVGPVSPLLVGTAFACSLAMPLPVSTPPNAMAFSSGDITVAEMLRPGTLITIIGVALAFTAGYWWWGFVGVI